MSALAVVARSAVWRAWSVQPVELVPAAALVAAYVSGRAGARVAPVGRARAAAFVAGVAVAVLAVVSPLHAASDALFSAHMAQHLIVMLVAAPLIVAGRPGLVLSLAVPRTTRSALHALGRRPGPASIGRLLRRPVAIFLAFTAALWLWHLPALYQAALRAPVVHALEHVSFLLASVWFWTAAMRAGPRRRVGSGPAMALVLATMLESTWLAAVLTFGRVAYPAYALRTRAWGIDPAADQHVAGTMMWVVSAVVYFAVFGVLFARWLRELDLRHPPFAERAS